MHYQRIDGPKLLVTFEWLPEFTSSSLTLAREIINLALVTPTIGMVEGIIYLTKSAGEFARTYITNKCRVLTIEWNNL